MFGQLKQKKAKREPKTLWAIYVIRLKELTGLFLKLPVWPAAVDRLRSPILYSIHGCSFRNASPGLSLSTVWQKSSYTGAPSCCCYLKVTLAASNISAILWLRMSCFVPPKRLTATVPVPRQTEVGRLEAWGCYHDFTLQAPHKHTARERHESYRNESQGYRIRSTLSSQNFSYIT